MIKILNPTSDSSPAIIARILDALAAGPIDTLQVIAATGLASSRARNYLQHLVSIGRVYQLAPYKAESTGRRAALWALGTAPDAPAPQEAIIEADDLPPIVVVIQQWKPNHVRSELDCFFFGVPAAMQGAHA